MTRLALALLLLASPAWGQERIECMVMDAIDGDTYRCMSDNGLLKVRERCLQTPERGEEGFAEATGDALALLPQWDDVTLIGPFRWTRRWGGTPALVADTELPDGRILGWAMQELGWPNYEKDPLCR